VIIHYHRAMMSSDRIERDFVPGFVKLNSPRPTLEKEIDSLMTPCLKRVL
jgi:hypothetical protein